MEKLTFGKINLLYFLIALVLAISLSGIFTINIQREIISGEPDSFIFISFFDIVKRNILTFSDPFAGTDFMRYPLGINFRLNTDGLFAILTGALLSIFLEHTVAFNLVIFLIFMTNIFLSLVFFNKIGKLYNIDDLAGGRPVLSAFLFALSPYFLARILGHLNLAFIGGFPVLIYSIAVFERKLRNDIPFDYKDYARLFTGILAIAFGSLQYLIILAYIAVAIAAFFLLTTKNTFIKTFNKIIGQLTGTFGVFFIIFSGFMVLFLFMFGGFVFGLFTGDLIIFKNFTFDVRLIDFLVPNSFLSGWLTSFNNSPPHIEKVIFLGVPALLFWLYFLFFSGKKPVQFTLLGFTTAYILLSAALLQLPGYYEGVRFTIVLQLLISLLVLLLPSFLNKNNVYLFVVLTVISTFFYVKIPYKTEIPVEMLSVIRQSPGEAILVLPVSIRHFERNMFISYSGKKLLDGAINQSAAGPKANSYLAENLRSITCGVDYRDLENPEQLYVETMEKIRSLGIKTVVIERVSVENLEEFSSCKYFVEFFYRHYAEQTTQIFKDARYEVYVFK
ncbi:hypothetical protein C4561_03695 [candidate division WWE3 bacterium]|jgi:hypothetical protein|uniref:Glycosyltransferase RgtA/B/C/D-like domain-containing protein n=1 Tax=candidate division WWE3 bacterium TaxID=2053526 RepID=A0A3A4ZC93_UNCKA|nr:MAG: hypothetical protein C4561_03695 [candidate division WWE3 bacterium]